MDHFGNATGSWMHHAAWGRDERAVVTSSEPVSISRETTFDRDLHAVHDKAELGAVFTQLCEQLAADLQRKGYVGRTVGIKLRYDDFKAATRDQTLDFYTADAKVIRHTAGLCLKRVPLQQRLRLLGVRMGNLEKADKFHEVHRTSQVKLAAGLAQLTSDAHNLTQSSDQLF